MSGARVSSVIRAIGRSSFFRNSVFVGGIFAASEFTQETIIGVEKYDVGKICRFGVFGLCFNGPFNYTWFRLLDATMPGKTLQIAVKKLALDQLVAAPIAVSGFFIGMDILEGREDIFREAKEKGPATWLAGCGFWVPAQLINFKFVAPHFRVVYVGIVAFLWANFLCYVRRSHGSSEADLTEIVERVESRA